MDNNLGKLEENIEKEIRAYISNFNEILDNLTSLSSSIINNKFWKLRSDLELLIIEMKLYLKKEDLTERWQASFKNELKGTSSRSKAGIILKEYRVSVEDSISVFKKKPETTYKYLWKLKETISSVLSAFPVERIELFYGEKKQVSEDVFEI